jgi:drug/metabolite transporter (DMT)-like permease
MTLLKKYVLQVGVNILDFMLIRSLVTLLQAFIVLKITGHEIWPKELSQSKSN